MEVRIARWYLENIRVLTRIYGEIAYDQQGFAWIYIKRFILPPYFNQPDTALLITTPKSDLMRPDGFSFYLNKNLQRTDGKPTGRLHENDSWNPYSHKGYSRISFHINDFRPRSKVKMGDNLLDICESLYNFLGNADGIL